MPGIPRELAASASSDAPHVARRLAWRAGLEAGQPAPREWLVTNGLGGYASGTIGGAITRRFHGLLIAAHPAPLGRVILVSYLDEHVRAADGRAAWLNAYAADGRLGQADGSPFLTEFRLEWGLPVWRYTLPHAVIERTLVMPQGYNTVQVTYRLVAGEDSVELTLRPLLAFRGHEAKLAASAGRHYRLARGRHGVEVDGGEDMPTLRLALEGTAGAVSEEAVEVAAVHYAVEEHRGYDHVGALTGPLHLRAVLAPGRPVTLLASSESWDHLAATSPDARASTEHRRRAHLLAAAAPRARHGMAAELVLAADQFVIAPATRPAEAVRTGPDAHARTVIAGYPWFTDWGRDTMIALEGLTLVTGRHHEARQILLTFSQHVRDGLIPNLFPEGQDDGLYHTADATLWFFHALDRYAHWSRDHSLVDELLPILQDIVAHHVAGTRFGIGVDGDGLLRQGAEGYQLTWMDAKVDGWVVTPRRGKPVEINALWFNALSLLAGWLDDRGRAGEAAAAGALAGRARDAFNRRFWSDAHGHLLDVVDGEQGDDPACRPNQLLAFALPHKVLDRARWAPVLDVVRTRLLTPRGLRSLSPDHPDYQPRYTGNLHARDAAYHQGTVWSWLVGPYLDAWLALHPGDLAGARAVLTPMLDQLDEGCVGSVSEIFDGETPFTPRGCFAQAWGVAELLRTLVATADAPAPAGAGEGAP